MKLDRNLFTVIKSSKTKFVCVFTIHFAALSAQTITTVAGNNIAGYSTDTLAIEAMLNVPGGITGDAGGNIYFCDVLNNRIRKIDVNGQISTIAGNGVAGYKGDSAVAINAELNKPSRIACLPNGEIIFTDYKNHCVRKIDNNGIIVTIAGNGTPGFSGDGGPATQAQLNFPMGLCVDNASNILIADVSNSRIRKITGNTISTIAGDGLTGYKGDGEPANQSRLYFPFDVMVSGSGNIYIADVLNYCIRVISSDGIINTIAGIAGQPGESYDGDYAAVANLGFITAFVMDEADNIYFTENNLARIMVIKGLYVYRFAGKGTVGYSGDGGHCLNAEFNAIDDLYFNKKNHSLLISDAYNHVLREIKGIKNIDVGIEESKIVPSSLSYSRGQLNLFSVQDMKQFSLYDVTGKLMISVKSQPGPGSIGINLVNGLYFYSVEKANGSVATGKLLVTD